MELYSLLSATNSDRNTFMPLKNDLYSFLSLRSAKIVESFISETYEKADINHSKSYNC